MDFFAGHYFSLSGTMPENTATTALNTALTARMRSSPIPGRFLNMVRWTGVRVTIISSAPMGNGFIVTLKAA